jgi:photosystem II stability/assembly factor-like uncharacterized protein
MSIALLLRKSACAFILFFLIFSVTPSSLARASRFTAPAGDAIAVSIDPVTAANQANMPVIIEGSGFLPTTTAAIGSTALEITTVTPTQIDAMVPWGMAPGVYDLNLTTPGEPPFVLSSAFTVTSGLGKWINTGPFGGQVNDLVFQTGNPSRLYACVHEAGLFVSLDEGATWKILINDPFPMRLKISPADPNVLYVNTNRDILRSRDGGASWDTIRTNQSTPGGTLAAYPYPGDASTVFIAALPMLNNYGAGGDGELWISTDYGDTLLPLPNTGLTDKRVTDLAFDPQDTTHQTLLAGTLSGKIFQSVDGGSNWTQKADLHQSGDQYPARVERLLFNPFGAHEPWALKGNPFLPNDWPLLYRASEPERTTWTGVMVSDPDGRGPSPWPWSITFTESTIWNAYEMGYTSPNSGTLSWSALGQVGIPSENWRPFQFSVFAIDPAHPNNVYGGTRAHGVYKSLDGGQTWNSANQGLAGITPYALAVSPDNLDEIYSISQSDGVAKSMDGGRHWTLLNFTRFGMPWRQTSLVVDMHDPRVVYIGAQCATNQPSPAPYGDACVRISRDRGQTWLENVFLPSPPIPAGYQSGEVFAIAVDPHNPGRVLAGATYYPNDWDHNVSHPFGAFYGSDDYGKTWTRSNLDPTTIKGSYSIAFDTVTPDLVYANTDGTGLWKSVDGGVTWGPVSWPGCAAADTGMPGTTVTVESVAARPKAANEVFAFCSVYLNQQPYSGGLYRSTNAGLTWNLLPSTPQWGAGALLFLPSPGGQVLYYGGGGGLARSPDGGSTWSGVDGFPAGTIYAMAGWADANRSVAYVSTEAGLGTAASQAGIAAQAKSQVMPGGTYGLTLRLMSTRLYLPMLNRAP